ncbi:MULTISPECIES: LysR family transcriptional regulator [Pseudomonas]|uniref:LysR family transcriptional regulator n=1 Tax=Pseudomonas TaxID=286 RepID=UPI000D024642|nr:MULTISPECIES: LysR family transcriptional regulator [Pseudomonas]PRW83612.1 LysR family transcriptional regulator [Pseudomonas simiae]CAH0141177.1 HTH-type transcriptional regulator DmlR [Pseudomonas carnis]CAH0151112.1 HTH-type transcriptional regulator DmlR [Pseudomonas carnis]CAH0210830.1 HTH-type transcriptional regulator DmlR [Pseudomonas carnis]CAH0223984.1 HTH-type transcriptional regulator DmlR [Pseudomonas carnis]
MSGSFEMDLAAINAFVSVGDKGGFRAAASALGVTSAAVSKAVSRLESQLGVMLVARTTRVVRLTPAGVMFHARCKTIMADLNQAGHEAAEGATTPQGRLVIGVSRVFGRMRVLPVIADYVKQYPNVEVEVRLSDRPVDIVAEGVDLAIRIGHLPDSGLIASRITQTGHVLCGSPEYLATAGTPEHPDDLHKHSVVGYVTPDTAIRFTYRFMVNGVVKTISLPSRMTVDDGEALVAAGARSVGLVMVNDYLVEQQLSDGRLVRVLREYEMPSVPISAVYLPTRNPSPVAKTFILMLRNRLAIASL